MFRIMLVDDEPHVLSALRRDLALTPAHLLGDEKLLVETYASAAEALKRAEEAPFDLVVSDFRMPEMDGLAFLKRMAERHPRVARIVLSGQADLDAVVAALNEAQIQRFIGKPWHAAELRATLAQVLKVNALERENARLADLVRRQQRRIDRQTMELERLERESPGITRLERAPDGSILIEDDEDDLATSPGLA